MMVKAHITNPSPTQAEALRSISAVNESEPQQLNAGRGLLVLTRFAVGKIIEARAL